MPGVSVSRKYTFCILDPKNYMGEPQIPSRVKVQENKFFFKLHNFILFFILNCYRNKETFTLQFFVYCNAILFKIMFMLFTII